MVSSVFGLFVVTAIAARSELAAANPDLLDIVARIEYGYYAGDGKLISAAAAELDRLHGTSAAATYYAAYAWMRLNQVDSGAAPRLQRQRADDCLAAVAELVAEPAWAAEAHVLAAACVLTVKSARGARVPGLQAKLARSIEAARAIEPDNPRLLLVAASTLPSAAEDAHAESPRLAALRAALARFDEQAIEIGPRPRWGRAEVLASLGALHLARGDAREARDLIEHALLEAPGYDFALQLQKALSLD